MSSQRTKSQRTHVSTTILPTLKESLQEEALRQDRSVGYIIEQAVIQYLQRLPPDPAKTRF